MPATSGPRETDEHRLRHGTLGRIAPSWAYEANAFPNGWALLAVVFALAALGLSIGPDGLGLSSALPFVVVSLASSWRAGRSARRDPWRGGGGAAVAARVLCGLAVVIGVLGALG